MRAAIVISLVLALLAPTGASAITTPKLPLPVPTVRVQVPKVPLPQLPVPKLPPVPVPTVPVPPLSTPTPAPTRAPDVASPSPKTAPRPSATSKPATAASTPAAATRHGVATPAPAPASRRAKTSPGRRSRTRPGVRQTAPRRAGRVPAATPVAVRRTAATERASRGRARAHADHRGPIATALGGIGDAVAALPAAVLWGLIGMASIALALAGNAYRQSRRRTALETQRAELLADVGVLSSALLPRVPALEGLTVSAAYRPADGPAAGGDFYDVFELDPERVGVLLGDVSGHGRDTVTHAALARYTLRTLLAAGHGPAAALALADRMLVRDLAPRFVTVIAAVFDRPTGTLTYAKAGHQPPIVLGTDHDPGAEPSACPIGLGLGESWPEFSLELVDGAVVCLYTDGLEDARLAEARLGREEVLRLLEAQDAPDARTLIADIGRIADRLSDDLTAVVLRPAGVSPPPPAAIEGPAAVAGDALDHGQVVVREGA